MRQAFLRCRRALLYPGSAQSCAVRVVDIGMRLVGGGAYRRGHPLEKLYRDARSGPFHPLTTDQLMQHLGSAELG